VPLCCSCCVVRDATSTITTHYITGHALQTNDAHNTVLGCSITSCISSLTHSHHITHTGACAHHTHAHTQASSIMTSTKVARFFLDRHHFTLTTAAPRDRRVVSVAGLQIKSNQHSVRVGGGVSHSTWLALRWLQRHACACGSSSVSSGVRNTSPVSAHLLKFHSSSVVLSRCVPSSSSPRSSIPTAHHPRRLHCSSRRGCSRSVLDTCACTPRRLRCYVNGTIGAVDGEALQAAECGFH